MQSVGAIDSRGSTGDHVVSKGMFASSLLWRITALSGRVPSMEGGRTRPFVRPCAFAAACRESSHCRDVNVLQQSPGGEKLKIATGERARFFFACFRGRQGAGLGVEVPEFGVEVASSGRGPGAQGRGGEFEVEVPEL